MQTERRPWDIGTGVAGHVWEAERPRAVLLLQHGFGEYAERFVERYNRLIPHLVSAGVSVHALDMRGHGRSSGRRAVTDIGRAVEDHLEARRRLAVQPFPVFLLGHSLGGLVTAGSVARDPSGVSGVILSSPLLVRWDDNAVTRRLSRLLARVAPALPATIPNNPRHLSRVDEVVRLAVEDPHIYRGSPPMLLAATTLGVLHDGWARFPDWDVPTLVFHGTADRYTDPRGSRRFVEVIRSSDKTLHLVPGGYHELLHDVDGDDTLRVVLDWLERRLPATYMMDLQE